MVRRRLKSRLVAVLARIRRVPVSRPLGPKSWDKGFATRGGCKEKPQRNGLPGPVRHDGYALQAKGHECHNTPQRLGQIDRRLPR
jgi:hypothetical protein